MNVRMGLIRKKPDWSFEKFNDYWHHQHGALASRVPGLRAYWQNPVTERLQRGIDFARGPWEFDGFSQLWLDNPGGASHAFKDSDIAANLIADETFFLGGLHIVTVEQRVVIELPEAPARARLLKRMSILKRRTDITEEDFRREWQVHGDLVRQMPGVSGYRQNVVVARELTKGRPCGYDDFPIDGIVELWFENAATLEAAFGSAAGKSTMAHAKTFLSEITAFGVEERRIL
ncbi:MAG: EthD family reductase [Variovorax sp.]|nr:MAG: EthD family reductase [Variovorax sp.]